MSAGLIFFYVLLGFTVAFEVFYVIVLLKGGHIEVGRKHKKDRTNGGRDD